MNNLKLLNMKSKINGTNFESFKDFSFKNLQAIYGGDGDDDDNDTDRGKIKLPGQGASGDGNN